jgi:hypothetical protein
MSILRSTINGKEVIIQKRQLAPGVFAYFVSFAFDPTSFPMVLNKETKNWIFVDKMTFVELIELESGISDIIKKMESNKI